MCFKVFCIVGGYDSCQTEILVYVLGLGVELFNASILQELDLSKMPELRQNLKVRPLRVDDWGRGYLNVLEQLTVVGAVLETDYRER